MENNENKVFETKLPKQKPSIPFDIENLASVQVGLASPEEIRSWSHGEVTKAETINYRSQKPEKGGLFCEKIFGPSKDYECNCGKYKKIRYQGITCEKCGVEVISKEFRRERMGHIELVSPCCHIWYLKSIPSRIGLVLDVSPKQLEDVIYFAAHICLNPGESAVLKYKDYLSESEARDIFSRAIDDLIKKGTFEGREADLLKAQELIKNMADNKEAFNFFEISAFITRFTGAEFGEGAEAIKRLLHEVDLDKEFNEISAELKDKDTTSAKRLKLSKRLDVINAFRDSNQKPEWMILDVVPVIPPDLRPMLQLDGGRFAASDLNDLYRRVISRNDRLKRLINMSAPYVILMNEKRMLQEAVDALIDNGRRTKAVPGPSGRPLKSLSSGLKGKQGRFRQNLLGKRVDYSGRSVIAVGPDLKMYQCGLPREMAVQLLRPFIAAILINRKIVSAHKAADKIIDKFDPIVFDIVEEIISDHPVLLNRAPTLHRLGIQAFQPKLVDGRAIRLHPLVCPGFNADFDGDQMAVHVPLGKAAQREAINIMLASNNILGPKDGKAIVIPSQDMILGNFHLTTEETAEDFKARAARIDEIIKYNKEHKASPLEEKEMIAMKEANLHYAEMEGKIFHNVNEVIMAYETKQVSLHNRIAIPALAIHKDPYDEARNEDHQQGMPFSLEEAKNKYLITSVGKVIFNEVFPDDFAYINDGTHLTKPSQLKWYVSVEDVEKAIGKFDEKKFSTPMAQYIASLPLKEAIGKKQLGPLIDMIFKKYGTSKTSAVLDKIKDQGFKYSTISAVTVSMDDIKDVEGKYDLVNEGNAKVEKIEAFYRRGYLTNEERHKKIVAIWNETTAAVAELVKAQMRNNKRNPLVIMADSGSRGSVDNFKQLIGMKGLVANPKNEEIELPIVSSYREGMKVSEFFINTHGARKGSADTALKTADSGYLTRRLVDVSQDVIVREDDCHCDHGFKVREIRDTSRNSVIRKLEERIIGRFSVHEIVHPETGEIIVGPNEMINEDQAHAIGKAGIKEVEIRTIFTCKTQNGVCRHCYGKNMATGKLVDIGEAVGIMAAQSIGEPGTQLTMRVFHTGGMAGSDITSGLPRVQELVEARNPKGEALISQISGEVTEIKQISDKFEVVVTNELESIRYTTPFGAHLRVKVGDKVENGGKITEGAINPKKLLECGSVEKLEVYMIKEIQKVYSAQGIGISDKHLEIIIKQMLRKVVVVDGGDTTMLPGLRVSVERFTNENKKALLEGKRPAVAQPLVLGITKAALETDSFLSAASFQETTKVLTDAAIKAKKDTLHGLKENVITGKLIPAGTGLMSNEESDESLEGFTVASSMRQVKSQYVEKHDRQDIVDSL
ncbi:MAG: DNA-directed RNA polymerase subunit beta' [Bacilli bacterium]|nr:DNA-directed RNA polymerase subunit beta' [Bacilli bacterium]